MKKKEIDLTESRKVLFFKGVSFGVYKLKIMNDTYKYHFKVGNKIVHGGITDDLNRREIEHQNSDKWTLFNGNRLYWSSGHIVRIGNRTTREAALRWERDNGFGANQN